MFRAAFLFSALCLLLSACTIENYTYSFSDKYPPSVPQSSGNLDPDVTRKLIPVEFDIELIHAMSENNFSVEHNCIQLIEMGKEDTVIGEYLELSSVACPEKGVVSNRNVVTRKRVEVFENDGDIYKVVEEGYPYIIGWISAKSGTHTLVNLCQWAPHEYIVDYYIKETHCTIDLGTENGITGMRVHQN